MNCDLALHERVGTDRARYRCKRKDCGFVTPPILLDKIIVAPCRSVGGSKLQMASRFSLAIARWIAAGMPKRSDEQVADILQTCQACPLYHNGGCRKCGCRANSSKIALLNMIRMATKNCPEGKW